MMRVLETALLLVKLSVTMSESGESLGDGQLGNNDTRVTTNHTKHEVARDENHPLLTLMETRPHSMDLMVKVKTLKPETMVRLLYERVPRTKQPYLHHLDDPVIEYISLERSPLTHYLTELPMGKYIVCGEAMVKGAVYQASCFETRIERLDNNTLQTGVKVIIIISIIMVIFVVIYAILYRLCKGRCGGKEK